MDAAIERLLASVPPETLVVICSDHGESLGEHGEQTHGVLCFSSTSDVFLAAKGPGLRPGAGPSLQGENRSGAQPAAARPLPQRPGVKRTCGFERLGEGARARCEHIEDTPYGELWVEHGPQGLEAVPYRFTGKELEGVITFDIGLFSHDLATDLGTANILVYVKEKW